jgi:rhodanese-related sulfurtransferase
VPILHQGPMGMTPKQEFLQVMQRAFDKEEKLVVGCKSGARSLRAAEVLAQAGYRHLYNLGAGFSGSRDAFGRPLAGWAASGLPVENGAPEGHGYAAVKERPSR